MSSPALLLLLVAPLTARATTVGNPIPTPQHGRIAALAMVDWESQVVVDQACVPTEGTPGECEAVRVPVLTGMRLEADLLDAVGVFGDLGVFAEDMQSAAYSANGLTWGAGLRASVPSWRPWTLATVAQWESGTGRRHFFASEENAAPNAETVNIQWQRTRLAVMGAWVADDGSVFLWTGPTWTPWYIHEADLESDGLSYTFEPLSTWGGVAGVELRSDHLGLPWSASPLHLSVGTEVRYEGGPGFGVRARCSF